MCIPERVLIYSANIVEIDVAKAGTQNNEICSMWPGQTRSPADNNFFCLFFYRFGM